MSHAFSIARKELRAYFLSPIALIFIGTFLFVTLFTFFWVEAFYARNLADVRPLFEWLPILLIFLVGALTMRLWSEEQKLGTLEILFTLPVEIRKLVLGKFLGGLILVSLALALTFGLPITVAMMGDLDMGPVIGGYFAAVLLAGAYLAIGLCISSITENQIIALIVTVIICSILYVLGTEGITSLVGVKGGELLRAIGIGSRFDNIERGVIDLRDVVYYASVTVFFLVLNVILLEKKRWSTGVASASRRVGSMLMLVLLAANLLVLNLWLSSAGRVRLDLTQRREYSISDVTKNLIDSLEVPLTIRGYFSDKTHPKLDPHIPRIRDQIQEYAAVSGGKVKAEFVDPRSDPEVEKEANEKYGIKAFPFQVDTHTESAIVNAYFSVVLLYGDRHEVMSFGDLIDIHRKGKNDFEVKLKNLEYDLTKTIKKVAYGFQTLQAVLADLEQPMELTAYVTAQTLPPQIQELAPRLEKVLKEVTAQAGDKFKYQVVDPLAPENKGMPEEIYNKFRFGPKRSLFSEQPYYFYILLRSGDRYEQIVPPDGVSEADLKNEIIAAVKRGTPGFLKTAGVWKPKAQQPPQMHQFQQQQPPPDLHRAVVDTLGEGYTVKEVQLSDGRVPGDVDVLLVVAPENLDQKQTFAIDQYLMRGGAVVMLAGNYEPVPQTGPDDGLKVRKVNTGLDELLSAYGVTIQSSMVLDPQNEPLPVPVIRDLGGGLRIQDIEKMPYALFVDVRPDGMSDESPAIGGLPSVALNWASPVLVSEPEKKDGVPEREVKVLLRSTENSATYSALDVNPDLKKFPGLGFAAEGERKSYPLAVSIRGKFTSAFKGKPSPLEEAGAPPPQEGETRLLEISPETARLVVVGSSAFVNDMVLRMSQQGGTASVANKLQLVQNLLDWGVADTDLLTIRSRSSFARTLLPLDADKRAAYEYGNYGLVVLALVVIVGLTIGRRRRLKPIELDPAPGKRSKPSGTAISGEPTEVGS